ncbi:MAG TPA: carboxypeptidase-like regulatory domain-containing protein [Candidatus Koribacter sp.]|jgi:hypothetical protein
MKFRAAQISLFSIALLLSSISFADSCTAPPSPYLKSDFKLTVVDWTNAPLSGIKVMLGTMDRYSAIHPVAVGVTDSSGELNFRKIAAGAYAIRFTDHQGDLQLFNVNINPDGNDDVQYSWPKVRWISLHSASGILLRDNEPMRHYQVTLLSYPDLASMGVSDTDVTGRFDLPAVKSGRYWFGIAQVDDYGNSRPLGRIPVNLTVDPTLQGADPIFVGDGACGLLYDQYCNLAPSNLHASCVQTVDEKGTGISNASVILASQHGFAASSNYRSDKDGNVKLPGLPSGDYDLQIFAKGFAPVRQRISLAPGDPNCNSAIVVPMYTFGSGCVPAAQGKVN